MRLTWLVFTAALALVPPSPARARPAVAEQKACPTALPASSHRSPSSKLPDRLSRERAFCQAGISRLLAQRHTDEMDRDLLYLDAARHPAVILHARYPWLSLANAERLRAAVAGGRKRPA